MQNLISTALETLKCITDLIFPDLCAGCGKKEKTFCEDCKRGIEEVDPYRSCPLCGRFTGRSIICGECLGEKRNYSRGFFLYYYTTPIKNAIYAFKFDGKKRVGRILVQMANERIMGLRNRFDYLLPVPVTERRLKERGFNQAYIIAKEISRIISVPVLSNTVIKLKETKDQYTLDRTERAKNVKGVFALVEKDHLKDKNILVVDDLFTTGYTVMEVVKTLRSAQPKDVCIFAIARAL